MIVVEEVVVLDSLETPSHKGMNGERGAVVRINDSSSNHSFGS